jgi:hypothetical protein
VVAPVVDATKGQVGVMAGEATNGDAMDILANEGVGYAVTGYCSGDHFKDPKTTHLWDAAEKALNDLTGYLERETGRCLDDE